MEAKQQRNETSSTQLAEEHPASAHPGSSAPWAESLTQHLKKAGTESWSILQTAGGLLPRVYRMCYVLAGRAFWDYRRVITGNFISNHLPG